MKKKCRVRNALSQFSFQFCLVLLYGRTTLLSSYRYQSPGRSPCSLFLLVTFFGKPSLTLFLQEATSQV